MSLAQSNEEELLAAVHPDLGIDTVRFRSNDSESVAATAATTKQGAFVALIAMRRPAFVRAEADSLLLRRSFGVAVRSLLRRVGRIIYARHRAV